MQRKAQLVIVCISIVQHMRKLERKLHILISYTEND